MKYIKKYESEVSSGNASGKVGSSSLPFGKGFYETGNTGGHGIAFTPSSEPTIGSYKKMKHSKKNLKKKMKKIKKFEFFLKEDATATAGNTGGMGAVVAATPSSTPGDVAGSVPGSGDIGQPLDVAYMKSTPKLKKRKDKKYKMKKIQSYDGFNPKNENIEVDNFTARYYDNFDDEEEPANEQDLMNITKENIRKVQLYEKK